MRQPGLALTALGFLLSTVSVLRASETAEVGTPAPAFTLADHNGTPYSLNGFKGKTVVLEWVNYECPFVRKHYNSGNMQKLQREYTAKGVVWFSICSSAPGKQGYFEADEIKDRLAKEKAAPTAYLIDADGTIGKEYGAKTTPHMYVIDSKGVLVYKGGIDDIASTDVDDIPKATNYVSGALDAVLSGKEVAVTSSRPYGCSVKYR